MQYLVTVEGLKRTVVTVEATSEEEAKNVILGQLSNGEVPEFDDIWDSISVPSAVKVAEIDPEGTFAGQNEVDLQ